MVFYILTHIDSILPMGIIINPTKHMPALMVS